MAKVIKVTLVKSGIGQSKRIKATLRALGFRKLYQTIRVKNHPAIRGMLKKVSHLVKIELEQEENHETT